MMGSWRDVIVMVLVLWCASVESEVSTSQSPVERTTSTVPASTQLLNRLGGDGSSIHFAAASEDLRPQEVLESQVHRDVSRGVAGLALGLDRELNPPLENSSLTNATDSGSAPGRTLGATQDNVVFSPVSIAAVLALVLLGSGGQTFDEVAQVLGLSGEGGSLSAERDAAVHHHFGRLLRALQRRAAATDSSEALAAHAVFIQRGLSLRPRFRQVAQQAYIAELRALDFEGAPAEAQADVNAWVSEQTRGRIRNIMAEPPPLGTRLALASALYFNGQWATPFPRETTQKRPFYVDGDAQGEVLRIDMMANSADLLYADNAELRCKVLGLPYKGGDVVMYILLPHERGVAALRSLEARLTLDALERAVEAVRLEQDVIVVLPRMKLEFSTSLRDALERLGMHSLFTSAANLTQLLQPAAPASVSTQAPPLSGVANSRNRDSMHFRQRRNSLPVAEPYVMQEPLFVDDVLHKVELEVTEMGTVASAATLASVTRGSHLTVRADRPFLFFIRHQTTGLLLFWGSVVRPRPAPAVG